MIYFDIPMPAVGNIHGGCHVMETEYSYSSICYTLTHSLLFSLIDFACYCHQVARLSWFAEDNNTAVSSLSSQPARSMCWTPSP